MYIMRKLNDRKLQRGKEKKRKNKINAKSPVLSALDEKCFAPMIFPKTRKRASYWES